MEFWEVVVLWDCLDKFYANESTGSPGSMPEARQPESSNRVRLDDPSGLERLRSWGVSVEAG